MIIPLLLFSLELFVVTQQPFEWIRHTSELTSAEPKLITNSTWWVTSLSHGIEISIRFDGQKKIVLGVLYLLARKLALQLGFFSVWYFVCFVGIKSGF